MRRIPAALALLLVAVPAAAGCEGSGRDPGTVKVVYQDFGAFRAADLLFQRVKEEFEAANEGVTVELHPIEAPPEDYQTQVNLMNQSPADAPDIIYEDSFTINQDVDAGYLHPLDEYWSEWEDAELYNEQADAAVTALDGGRYGVMLGTDTRGLWYNTRLFEEAGVDVPWRPEDWEAVLDTARDLDGELGDEVTPLSVYAGTPAGEVSSMQGFQMLLSGTGDVLFDEEEQKWVTGTQGFVDSLEFIGTVYGEDLALDQRDALNANVATLNNDERIPAGEVAISLDGSWATQSWIESGNQPWPEWEEEMAFAPMPTQEGQDPGATSMSGGWTLAMGAHTADPDLAWRVMAHALSRENALEFAVEGAQIPVRSDVAESEEYRERSPIVPEAVELVDVTHFRPAYSDYPRISLAIQEATEQVVLGEATPEEAAAAYDAEVAEIVGPDAVTGG
ncbi:extracellular solute-binding protein [Nocardiopsis composta]|uniref:Multiple sugar transport system substrate-binding protein n=1 Tax=Nocardiopsis composta TaxID=157465 RepID=A0A7W8QKT8_9ACTN|nr:extracellular solute-binding protein [Nocardiopsis composta]MBB5432110.1 multiple sugar transport system substrate-binding protein [Nocardiopsis composta]